MLDFSESEWKQFSVTEQRIILLVRQQEVEDEERIRFLMAFPVEPMKKTTFDRHRRRIKKKVEEIREARVQS